MREGARMVDFEKVKVVGFSSLWLLLAISRTGLTLKDFPINSTAK